MSTLEPVAYSHGDAALTGWLARPQGQARAAILVLPTIANLTPALQRRAMMLADQGYLAMIADFYGESIGEPQTLAQQLRGDVDHYRARLDAGLTALRDVEGGNGLPIGAVGFCMGGQAALELARDGHDLFAVASFHGILTTDRPAARGVVRARILVLHGDADPLVPRAQVLAFQDEMNAAAASWHFHSYSGVKHGFTDTNSDARGMPAVAYDASADRQSWAATISLFDEILA